MNQLLDEIKVTMHNNGYSVEDIKKVVDSVKQFIDYVSRNRLGMEFLEHIGSFRNNILKRINGRKSVSNIASAAEFNGNSPASAFIKFCVEKKVQDVLNGFLKSAEVYYNMACNSEGVDPLHILFKLSLDGIDREPSVELTAPATIMAFSTELSLKTLYSVKNYDAIVRNVLSEVTRCENGRYPNESLLNDKLRMIEKVSGDWKNIGISSNAQNTMNDVRDSYSISDKPVNLPEDDKFGNVKINGHTLYKVFDNLPEEYRTMIKYQIATAFSRGDKKSLDDRVVGAIDYFLMMSEVDTTLGNMDSTKQMVINSNNFDRMRYLIDQLGSEDLLFSMAYASSSYIVAKNEVEGRSFSSIRNCDYTSKGLQCTEELFNLINNDSGKKYLLDYIANNRQLLGVAKTLNPKDLYVLIDMFNLDEINWMKDSCNVVDTCSFKEMMYYCVFFKKHLNDYEFRYTGDKYKNINKLFYTIKSTNNLAMLGSQISHWFAQINIYDLTQEEFDVLKIFDNEFIFNSLNYKDRVLYKKCSDKGIPFKIHYTSTAYSTAIAKYMNEDGFNPDNFEEQVSFRVNRNFNRLLVVNDEKLNKLRANQEVYDLIIEEFGRLENVPSFLVSLPLDDIRVILEYCKSTGESVKEWSQQLLATPCFFCRSMFIIDKVKSCYTHVNVRLAKDLNKSHIQDISRAFTELKANSQRIIPMRDEIAISNNSTPSISVSESYIYSMSLVTGYSFELEVERATDKELMTYLLENGFDYLSATFLQKNASREQIDKLLDYSTRYALPRELITMVASNRLSIEELIAKNDLFVRYGCRLDDIPMYYYTATNITPDVFERLFNVLRGIYTENSIPVVLLSTDIDKVQMLIHKLRDANINIYDFVSYLSHSSHLVLNNMDQYIYVYSQLKQVPVSGDMIVKPFDMVVADYYSAKALLQYNEDNPILLKASLYQNYDDFNDIRILCEFNGKKFYPELLYFDKGFVKEYFVDVYNCVMAYDYTGRELQYKDAHHMMKSKGWYQREQTEELRTARRVA